MYIPKMRIVNVVDLEDESELSNITQLIRNQYFLDFSTHLFEDRIPHWQDDDYADIDPRLIKVYNYLCDNCNFLPGDSFIWSL